MAFITTIYFKRIPIFFFEQHCIDQLPFEISVRPFLFREFRSRGETALICSRCNNLSDRFWICDCSKFHFNMSSNISSDAQVITKRNTTKLTIFLAANLQISFANYLHVTETARNNLSYLAKVIVFFQNPDIAHVNSSTNLLNYHGLVWKSALINVPNVIRLFVFIYGHRVFCRIELNCSAISRPTVATYC